MSIPRDNLDQLLSGYLDDVLSDDEQKRIDQLLRDDQTVASELEDLRRMRGTLREISRADAQFRLDDGFADRVMQAAVAQATTEGLRDDHPLLKVAEHPSVPSRARRLPMTKLTGALVALAASITLGIVMLQPSSEPLGIALNTAPTAASTTNADSIDQVIDHVIDQGPATDSMTEKVVAAVKSVEQTFSADALPSVIDTASNPNEPVTASMVVSGDEVSVGDKKITQPTSRAVAESKTPAKTSPTEAEAAALLGDTNVLTLLVKQTEAGRQAQSVRDAMRGAEIDSAVSKELTEAMVGAVSDSLKTDTPSASGTQLVFLEVPARKVDVFYARLMADQEGIASVQLGLVATPAVRSFVKLLSPDAVRGIRHSKSWEFQGNQAGVVADQLASSQTFLPSQSMRGIPLTVAEDGDGRDQLARVLILIQ